MRLAATLDPAIGAKDFTTRLRESVKAIPWPDDVALVSNYGQRFREPDQKNWLTSDDIQRFRSATIHSVKGQEFPGVVVVVPKNPRKDAHGHVLDHWENQLSTEPRRVLYVGASRAQRLLIFAVHNSHMERVAELLTASDVLHARV
jgi:superfamily I DNA/RNA helicase